MSTPNPIVFPPLIKGFNWTLSTTGAGGAAIPTGQVETGVTIGIRADGDMTRSPGNYQYLVIVPAGQTSETPDQINAALGKSVPPGNYWAALDQTDMLNGKSSTSPWTAEILFSIPPTIVQPAPPTAFGVA